ncbi:chromatin target of PRMT1b isoform X2 [Clarias gariepinus]|uniref:chromatin target of PRMT1b isoform X2 n=1 Tax=Clarias gariepinus TaxID=13013 RepID=UPI00234C532D|nr:chromatin target of PRMT1b isoform X2 [Clarias gariepinus]
MTTPSSQVLLKSTSSMSLDERFTMMLKKNQVPLIDTMDAVPQQLTASVKNQRLAQQMANRPSVLAALQSNLRVKQNQFKGSIKTRLGPMMRGGLHGMSRSWRRPRGKSVVLRGAFSQRSGRGMMFVGRGLAGRHARPGSRPLPTREELDAQLDDYMSMTKSQLDAQLDAYMAEVDPERLL